MNPFIPIRILTTKIGHNKNILNYVVELAKEVSKQEGFIKTNKYWKISNEPTIITMTDWESKIAWQRWFHSYERSDIHKKYANDIKKEKYIILMKKKDNNDIFLL